MRRLGGGEEADVYLVLDGETARAAKVLRGVDAVGRARLAGEFRRLAALCHPRLVRVHDLEVAGDGDFLPAGATFFTADYVEGRTPRAAIDALPAARRGQAVLRVASDVAAALAHIHAAGLLHRDVKPANVLVDGEGRATLLDLGLATARALGGVARGTPAYMAPEALAGAEDPRSDLYSLGATLYEAACGRRPFGAALPGEAGAAGELARVVRAILEDPLVPPRELAPELPAPLAALVARLLARDPSDRHASAAALLDDLDRVAEACGWEGPVAEVAAEPERAPAARGRGRRGARRPPAASPPARRDAPPALLPPPLVGREGPLAALDASLRALASGGAAPAVVWLAGAAGCGKTRLVDEALRRAQLRAAAGRAPAVRVVGDTWAGLVALLEDGAAEAAVEAGADPGDTERATARLVEQVASALARAAAGAPLVVRLTDADADERSAALAALAGAGGLGGARALVIAEGGGAATGRAPDEGGPIGVELELPSLTAAEVGAVVAGMLGRPAAAAWAGALAAATGGVPRLVVEATRLAALRRGVEEADRVPVAEVLGEGAGLANVVERRLAALAPRARALLEAVAVWGGPVESGDAAALAGLEVEAAWAEAASLVAGGLLAPLGAAADARLACPSPHHAAAVLAAAPAPRRAALHRAALGRLAGRGAAAARARARHLAAVGPAAAAVPACREAAAAARAEGDLPGARSHLADALGHARGAARAAVQLERARVAAVLGRYDEALAAAAEAGRDPALRSAAELVAARAEKRAGDPAAAEARLAALVDREPGDEEARGELARLRVARGDPQGALAIAGAPEGEPPARGAVSPGRAVRLEAAGLAALYAGDLARAGRAFDRLLDAAAAGADEALRGRAHGLAGLLRQRRGELAAAATSYADGVRHARAAGDVHAAAVYALNLASVAAERGLFGEVLVATEAAIRDLRRLGRVGELAGALHNRAVALVALGDVEAARRAAAAARAEARARGQALVEIHAELIEADVARREGALDLALAACDRAAALARSLAAARALVAGSRAEALAEAGRAAEARAAAAEAEAAAVGDDERDRAALAAARVTVTLGDDPRAALEGLHAVRRRLREAGRLDLAWRAEAIGARLLLRAGEAGPAAAAASAARALREELAARVADERQAGLRADPEERALAALERELRARARAAGEARGEGPAPAAAAVVEGRREERLRSLLALAKRLNSELRLERLLDDVMDSIVELARAERGFLLLTDEATGTLEVKVARNIDQRALAGDALALSRSIAEQAARGGEPVVTVDAALDARFGAAASVSALRLRSVLAVPLRVRGRVVGTVYVDHRFRRGAFDEETVERVLELADVAAVALHNARLLEDNERARREVAALAARLEAELERQGAELEGARAALRATEAAGLRHAYDALVGRSPRMLELLRLLDRATETALPVVIVGESGTGKELVARALHQNGPRRERPFVPVNCAAVPEPLLEAELFGHVRGAFTGADRDRRGLFEVADGGTIFLDEIADTSAAMQTRLLRVLQEGEVRRVGGERPRTVDVRVVAASNRDLRRLVEAGTFREDLFYRLHVIRIEVPALRERAEDVPALVEHFLGKLAAAAGGRPPPRVDRSALARLMAYPWPGNVRELENELARAVALGGELLSPADFSPAIAATDPAATPASPDDLTLKPRVERLEVSLLREALGRARGNQTVAARLLGLSRFGLQKKLRRYRL